jgi:hypothetical protein
MKIDHGRTRIFYATAQDPKEKFQRGFIIQPSQYNPTLLDGESQNDSNSPCRQFFEVAAPKHEEIQVAPAALAFRGQLITPTIQTRLQHCSTGGAGKYFSNAIGTFDKLVKSATTILRETRDTPGISER